MRRRTAVFAVLAAVGVLAGCNGDDNPPPARVEAAITATAASTSTARPTLSPAPPPTATPSPAPAAETSTPEPPMPTPILAPMSTPAPGEPVGFPLSTNDVRVAVEEAGVTFWLRERSETLCPGTSVEGRAYWSANRAGTDFGPIFTLWVYPNAGALGEDWEAKPGEAPVSRVEDCEPPGGFVYWTNNVVLAFTSWLSAGEELPLEGHYESPGDHPAVRAFLELSP